MPTHFAASVLLAAMAVVGCVESEDGPPVLTAEVPLHLEEHLDAATVEGSGIAEELPEPVVWRFDEAQPDWKPVTPRDSAQATELEPVACRLELAVAAVARGVAAARGADPGETG